MQHKLIKLFVLLFATAVMVQCHPDKNEQSASPSILGDWKYKEENGKYYYA
ncbi:MAG: hypothetical protein PSX36_10260 [bacterium]|nr:hypothetical protein [bacterium]